MARNLPRVLKSLIGRDLGRGPLGGLISRNARIWHAEPAELWKASPGLSTDPGFAFTYHEDFLEGSLPSSLTAANDGGTGTNLFNDAAGGTMSVVTAAADNDYHAIHTDLEAFKFAAGADLVCEMRFMLTEATTNESTWWFGLTDTLTTGGMQANALGPLASYDGALIYKTPETALTVNFETSNATTQNTLSAFATGISATWHRAGFSFDADAAEITPFFHDGSSWTVGTAQDITLAGLEEMHLVAGVKAGPSGGAESLVIDYIRCSQLRV